MFQFVMIYNPAQDAIPTPPGISRFRKYIRLRHLIKSSETLQWMYIKLFGMYAWGKKADEMWRGDENPSKRTKL